MGRVLNLTPPTFEGNAADYAMKVERYLYQLQEQVDYALLKLQKQTGLTGTVNTVTETEDATNE